MAPLRCRCLCHPETLKARKPCRGLSEDFASGKDFPIGASTQAGFGGQSKLEKEKERERQREMKWRGGEGTLTVLIRAVSVNEAASLGKHAFCLISRPLHAPSVSRVKARSLQDPAALVVVRKRKNLCHYSFGPNRKQDKKNNASVSRTICVKGA
jgi:hypothetical protein